MGNYPGGSCPGGNCPGDSYPGVIVLVELSGGNCPGVIVLGVIALGVIVLGGYCQDKPIQRKHRDQNFQIQATERNYKGKCFFCLECHCMCP